MEGLPESGKADLGPATTSTTLELLASVEANRHVSQRTLATRLGIAVGLANGYFRRCVHKGWIKMSKAPARRYAYYLTPRGFAEKSRLTAEYLALSFDFFRNARTECIEVLKAAEASGWRRIVLFGAGELAEIATLAAREANIQLIAILAPGRNEQELVGLPLVTSLEDVDAFDAVLITDIQASQQSFDELRGQLEPARILTPPLLHISREKAAEETETVK